MLRLNFLLLLAVMLSALYLVQTQYESRRLFTALHQATNEARNLKRSISDCRWNCAHSLRLRGLSPWQPLRACRVHRLPSRTMCMMCSKREVRSEARPELHLQPLAGQQDTCMAQQICHGLSGAGFYGAGRTSRLGAGDRQ